MLYRLQCKTKLAHDSNLFLNVPRQISERGGEERKNCSHWILPNNLKLRSQGCVWSIQLKNCEEKNISGELMHVRKLQLHEGWYDHNPRLEKRPLLNNIKIIMHWTMLLVSYMLQKWPCTTLCRMHTPDGPRLSPSFLLQCSLFLWPGPWCCPPPLSGTHLKTVEEDVV